MNKQDYTFKVRYRQSVHYPTIESNIEITATSLRKARIMIDEMLSGSIIYSAKLVNTIIYY